MTSRDPRSAETTPADVSSRRPRGPAPGWTLLAAIAASGLVFLDSTAVNVALPAIGGALGTGLSGLQWVVDGYILTLASLLIPAGSLADMHGRRRMMRIGIVGFALASAACGLAASPGWLIGARLVQGAAGALLVPGSLALLTAVFPEGEERGRAIGRWSGWSGITTVIGPLLGGWLVDHVSWRWVFFLNLPIAAVTLWILSRRVPESRGESGRVDYPGGALAVIGLGGLTLALIEGPVHGWRAPILLALAVGTAALLLFPLVEARRGSPMVPLELFRSRTFVGANLTTLGVYFALYGAGFYLVLHLQNVAGYAALLAGLSFAPLSILLLLLSPSVGRLAGRIGTRPFLLLGPAICAAGYLLMLRIGADAEFWTEVLPAATVLGLGMTVIVAPLTDTVVSSVPERHVGLGSAFNNAISRAAALVAVAGLGVIVHASFRSGLEHRIDPAELSPPARAALARIAREPTGNLRRTELPEEAARAVKTAFTGAFHDAMEASALAAFLGGLAALLLCRGVATRPGGASARGGG